MVGYAQPGVSVRLHACHFSITEQILVLDSRITGKNAFRSINRQLD